jgi:hypothetical protein
MRNAQPADWKTKLLPRRRTTIPVDRAFSQDELNILRRGLIPVQMEDKWFIYWKDDALYFHRSWTGDCIYIVHFVVEDGTGKMVRAEMRHIPKHNNPSPDEETAKMISYLIDMLLLDRARMFPSDNMTPEESSIMSWSTVGRAMLGQHPNGTEGACDSPPTHP